MPGITPGMTAEGLALPRNEKRRRMGGALKFGVRAARYGVSERPLAASRGFIDDVIAPATTRRRLCRALAMLRDKQLVNPWKKHDNIPL